MGQITGGKVTFLKRIQKAQFEPVEAAVEISFAVGDGEDHQAIFDTASNAAKAKVEELLTGKPAPAGRTKADLEAEAIARGNKPDATEVKTRQTRRPPSSKPATTDAETLPADDVRSQHTVVNGKPKEDPKGDATTTDEDIFSAGGDEPAKIIITDEVLLSKIAATNGKIKNPPAIRALIGEYFKPEEKTGKQAKDIPQEEREDFLAELAKLQPA